MPQIQKNVCLQRFLQQAFFLYSHDIFRYGKAPFFLTKNCHYDKLFSYKICQNRGMYLCN